MPARAFYDMRKDDLVHFEDDKMVNAKCGGSRMKSSNFEYGAKND